MIWMSKMQKKAVKYFLHRFFYG